MFRESLQLLACLSMLTSSNSLHMARDAFRRPPQLSDIDGIELSDETNAIKTSTNQHHRSINNNGGNDNNNGGGDGGGGNSNGIVIGTISNSAVNNDINRMPDNIYNRQIVVDDVRNNDIEQNINRPLHRQDAPRALQELFAGPSTLDIRLEQQQRRLLEQKQQQQHQQQQQQQNNEQQHQSKRAQSSGIAGGGGGGGGSGGSGNSGGGGGIIKSNLAQVSHGIASQLMLRSPRGQRNYDVPQIGKSIFNIYKI